MKVQRNNKVVGVIDDYEEEGQVIVQLKTKMKRLPLPPSKTKQKYVEKKYEWDTGTVDRINWGPVPSHKIGTGKRVFVVSYCHQ